MAIWPHPWRSLDARGIFSDAIATHAAQPVVPALRRPHAGGYLPGLSLSRGLSMQAFRSSEPPISPFIFNVTARCSWCCGNKCRSSRPTVKRCTDSLHPRLSKFVFFLWRTSESEFVPGGPHDSDRYFHQTKGTSNL